MIRRIALCGLFLAIAASTSACSPLAARTEYSPYAGRDVTRLELPTVKGVLGTSSYSQDVDVIVTHEGNAVVGFVAVLRPHLVSDLPRGCRQFEWSVDGRPFPTTQSEYGVTPESSSFRETIRVTAPAAALPKLSGASRVTWRTCETEHELSPYELGGLRDFARRVQANR